MSWKYKSHLCKSHSHDCGLIFLKISLSTCGRNAFPPCVTRHRHLRKRTLTKQTNLVLIFVRDLGSKVLYIMMNYKSAFSQTNSLRISKAIQYLPYKYLNVAVVHQYDPLSVRRHSTFPFGAIVKLLPKYIR